jgi:hypothetical protein
MRLRDRFRRSTAFRRAFEEMLEELDARPSVTIGDFGGGADDVTPASAPTEPDPRSLAGEWWSASRADVLLHRHGSPRTARMAMVWRSSAVAEHCPEVRWLMLDLGQGLDEEGLLAGPFDERAEGHAGPLGPFEPGPSRLAALITLAGYASLLRHPRRRQWRKRAIEGAAGAPGSVGVLAEPVRVLLAGLGCDLPE